MQWEMKGSFVDNASKVMVHMTRQKDGWEGDDQTSWEMHSWDIVNDLQILEERLDFILKALGVTKKNLSGILS